MKYHSTNKTRYYTVLSKLHESSSSELFLGFGAGGVFFVRFFVLFFLKPNKRELESLVLYEYQSLEFLVQVCSLYVVLD